jgi:hypothetical protein
VSDFLDFSVSGLVFLPEIDSLLPVIDSFTFAAPKWVEVTLNNNMKVIKKLAE